MTSIPTWGRHRMVKRASNDRWGLTVEMRRNGALLRCLSPECLVQFGGQNTTQPKHDCLAGTSHATAHREQRGRQGIAMHHTAFACHQQALLCGTDAGNRILQSTIMRATQIKKGGVPAWSSKAARNLPANAYAILRSSVTLLHAVPPALSWVPLPGAKDSSM